jgi:hypothetical protein
MIAPAPPAQNAGQNAGMVRILSVAIGIMTIAIIVLFAAIVARLLNPKEEEGSEAQPQAEAAAEPGTIDFAAAPTVEIGLPPGVRVVETYVSADRATFLIETAQGEKGVYSTPLDGYDEPVRLVFHTLE